MLPIKTTVFAATLVLAASGAALAQDSNALINILVRKGILTEQEADDVRADLAKESAAAAVQTAKGNFLEKVTLTGRLQGQHAALSTDIDGTTADPASVNHFFARRIRLGVRAQLFSQFSGYVNYDFSSSSFDAAMMSWKFSDTLSLDAGLRKAPIGYEEFIVSSGSLKAIERSGVTRYFVECNNGRRLGAGKYRQGLFLNGGNPREGFSWQLALTNPEAAVTAADSVSTGSASNDNFAPWVHAAYAGIFEGGTYKFGGSAGFLPNQGGRTLGTGNDLTVYNVFGDLTVGKFSLLGEVYVSDNELGASATADSGAWGWYIQPSYRVGQWELVARYGFVDSDGRGINLSDSVRSSPSGGTMDKLSEGYLGGTWYLRGNDVKVSAGYVWGESEDTIAGAPAKATTHGVRSQMQVNF
jgi:hypothetical protein